jgi:hypothetical protein
MISVDDIIQIISSLSIPVAESKHYVIFLINLFMLVFSSKLIVQTDNLGKPIHDHVKRVKLLRFVSALFLIVYTLAFIFNREMGAKWVHSYFVLLSTAIFTHIINHFILVRYGDHRTVDEEMRLTDNYISQMMRVSIIVTALLVSTLSLLQIWEFKTLFENGGVVFTMIAIVYATRESWIGEFISSFIIHAKGRLRRGSVIQLGDGEYYKILETNFNGTRLRNLKTETEVSMPNTHFLNEPVSLLSIEKASEKGNVSGKTEYKPIKLAMAFNIGYKTEAGDITAFFDHVMTLVKKEFSSVGDNYTLSITSNGDHAVTWEVLFYLSNPYQILKVKNCVNYTANISQQTHSINLSTPLTYSKVDG